MWKLTWNSQSSCLRHPRAGIPDVYNQAWLDLLYGYGHPSWDWQCSQSTVLCNTLWFGWRKLPDKSFGLSVILPRSSHMTPFTVILWLVTSLLYSAVYIVQNSKTVSGWQGGSVGSGTTTKPNHLNWIPVTTMAEGEGPPSSTYTCKSSK